MLKWKEKGLLDRKARTATMIGTSGGRESARPAGTEPAVRGRRGRTRWSREAASRIPFTRRSELRREKFDFEKPWGIRESENRGLRGREGNGNYREWRRKGGRRRSQWWTKPAPQALNPSLSRAGLLWAKFAYRPVLDRMDRFGLPILYQGLVFFFWRIDYCKALDNGKKIITNFSDLKFLKLY